MNKNGARDTRMRILGLFVLANHASIGPNPGSDNFRTAQSARGHRWEHRHLLGRCRALDIFRNAANV